MSLLCLWIHKRILWEYRTSVTTVTRVCDCLQDTFKRYCILYGCSSYGCILLGIFL